jgi:hypothetical protein
MVPGGARAHGDLPEYRGEYLKVGVRALTASDCMRAIDLEARNNDSESGVPIATEKKTTIFTGTVVQITRSRKRN